MLLKNKDQFKDNVEVYSLLQQFETAHKNQDALALSIVLTKLEQINIKISLDSKPE